jgi:tetratricopeptide (TPR) repeat protein
MFTPFSRLLVLLALAIASVTAAISGIWSLLIISTLASIVILWGYFRIGTVLLALTRIRKEDFKEAERIIDYTTKPERLGKAQRAYYFFVKGFVARDKENNKEAQMFLEEALQEGLKNESDRAMALLALADMALIRKNKAEAKDYFLKIKGLKVKSELMPSIRKMQEWLEV